MWKTGSTEWQEGLKTSVELRQHFRDWKAFVELFIRGREKRQIINYMLHSGFSLNSESGSVFINCVSVIFVIAVSYSNDN